METDFICQGRRVTATELDWIRSALAAHPDWSRKRLARELCQWRPWRNAQGQLKDFAARSWLLKLQARGLLCLPALRANHRTRRWELPLTRDPSELSPVPLGGSLASLQPLHWVQPVAGSVQERRFHDHLHRHHYLGMRVVGENLKYLVQTRDGADVACLLFGAAAWQARARDGYLGWNPAQRTQGLRYVANNTRFLVLPWVRVSGLASHLLSQAVRRLSSDWQLKHGKETQVLEILEALPAQRQADALVLSEVLQREVQYFQTPREHLHFQDLAAKGGPIGRGAVESTCGQLQTRVKRTGQFWKPAGLANMLALKAALQNEDWPSLWSLN